MNKVNGYCQIELPDRIVISDLTSQLTLLTKGEARNIIDNLGLGAVKLSPDQEERDSTDYNPIIRDALITKPIFIVSRDIDVGVSKTTFLGNLVEDLNDASALRVHASVGWYTTDQSFITILIDFERVGNVVACPTIYDIPVSISARHVTLTDI